MSWDKDLDPNSPQYLIAVEPTSPMRVMAGPGTGKTFTLQRRVARLLASGCNARRVLAVTFTRVAAEDLYREMKAIGVEGCENVQARTLHSLCLELLNRADVFASTGRTPRALNDYEFEPLLYDLDDGRFGNKRERRKRIKAFEAAWARQQAEEAGAPRHDVDLEFEKALVSWNLFHSSMLIGELIPVLLNYLQRNPLSAERRMFDHVLVDEYQDLNRAEQLIIDELSATATLSIVGDDDQSIYSFKHAHPDGIRQFADAHPGTASHDLDLCYRCPTRVVDMANALVSRNTARMSPPRKLVPLAERGAGDIDILQFNSIDEEVEYIAAEIAEKIAAQVVHPGEVLVLTPRRLIGARIRQALELRCVRVMSCFQEQELESKVAQERMAILKVAVNKYDRVALRWLLGCKSADFLKNQYAVLRAYCQEHGMEPWDVLESVCGGDTQLKKIANLRKRFQQIKDAIHALVDIPIRHFTGAWLPAEIEDVHDLRRLTGLAIDSGAASNLAELLAVLIEVITQPVTPEEVNEVRIMSLHKSKGLSGHMVVVAGCVDGLLPKKPEDGIDPAERERHIEEQRRLFYVAISRTKSQNDGREGILRITSAVRMPVADAMRMGARVVRFTRAGAFVRNSPFVSELGPSAPKPKACT